MEPGAKVTVIVFTEETWWPIYMVPLAILEFLEFKDITPTPKNISKPSKSLVIISLALSTFLRVFCARLALSE